MTHGPTVITHHDISKDIKRIVDIMHNLEVNLSNAESETTKAVARKFLGTLIKRSPIKTGRYVKSHKVGIDQKNTDVAPFQGKIQADRRSAAASALIEGFNTIGRAKNFKSIYISNSLFYSKRVEYLGWLTAPPYYVYHHAAMDMMGSTERILKAYIKMAKKKAHQNKKIEDFPEIPF